MKINKKTYLFFITSLLATSNNVKAAELAAKPYFMERRYGATEFHSQGPQGSLGVFRQGNIEYIPYEDSKGATGVYEREVSYSGQKFSSEQQGTVVYLGNSESPRMQDPAIRYHNPKTVKIKADVLQEQKLQVDFAEKLFEYNCLDLSNFNLSTSNLADFLSLADLSAVREIDISCSPEQATIYNANDFLVKLFENNTLRSLTNIDAGGSNISRATLEILRTKSDLRESLIRDMWKLDETSGKKVASVEINIRNTLVAALPIAEKRQLQTPGESRFSILYRSSDYFPGSAAHLQLFLK
jgi:hypothetical protein